MSGVNTAAADRPLWRHASFHLLWSSTFASGVGDRLALLAAMGILGYAGEGADNSSVISGIEFFFFLPYLIWSPFAGVLADRLPRRLVMFAADEGRAAAVWIGYLLIPFTLGEVMPEEQRWRVWLLIGVVGTLAATFAPAKLSLVPNVVPTGVLTRANAAVVCTGIIGNLVGFFVGGPMVEAAVASNGSLGPVMALAAGCYGVSGLFWLFVRAPYRGARLETFERSGAWRGLVAGVRYARRRRAVWVLIGAAALVWAGTSLYQPAVGVIAGGHMAFALLMGCLGVGMLAGSVVVGVLNAHRGSELLIAFGLVGCGVFTALQMVLPASILAMVVALCLGLSGGLLLAPLNTMVQRLTPDRLRGRVFAAKEVIQELGKVVVAGLVWRLPDSDPYMRPLCLGLAVVLVAAGVWGLCRFGGRGPMPRAIQNFAWRLSRLYAETVHRLRVRGRHRVPSSGPVVIVCNHRSGVDPVLVQAAVPRVIRWMMAAEYMRPELGAMWRLNEPIPVRRDQADPAAARRAIDVLRAGGVVGIFPEGRIGEGGADLREMRAGVGLIARRGGAAVVPVRIEGSPHTDHPFTALLRPSRSRVIFGEAFDLSDVSERDAWIERIRRALDGSTDADR